MPSKKKAAPETPLRRGGPGAGGAKKASRSVTAKKKSAKKTPSRATDRAMAAVNKKTGAKKTAKKATAKKTAPRATAPKKGAPKGPARKKPAAKSTTKKTAARKATRKTGARTPGKKTAGAKARRTTVVKTPRRKWDVAPETPPSVIPGLSEEDQIRSAKYLPRDLPKRLFEEERFVFPESYGVNRVRLLVRDPEWIFAYWDVSPEAMKGLARSLGERALALSRLTLRVLDPVSGGMSDILLPPGARWWYIRTDIARRTYRAEIGITLPSGEFRQLAESNAVVTPRVGPSRERARRRLSYRRAGDLAPEDAAAALEAERRAGLASEPWVSGGEGAAERGGASDTFRPAGGGRADRPGASDAFRPGASDTHRR